MITDDISLEIAQDLISRALALAAKAGSAIAVVVTDCAGNPIAAARMDGVGFIGIPAATRKAATAAAFRAPLGRLTEMISKDEVALRALGGMREILLLPGAAPIMSKDRCVGAVGIVGGHHSQDQKLADELVAGA